MENREGWIVCIVCNRKNSLKSTECIDCKSNLEFGTKVYLGQADKTWEDK